MRIAVAGGTGLTGRAVVDALRAAGDTPVVLARATGVDLTTGDGLVPLLDGVDAVIDVTNVRSTSASRSLAFFETVTTRLLAAERAAGVAHHLALSIVGVDAVDLGYYRGKRRQEELVLGRSAEAGGPGGPGGPNGTVLRATQFHEFAAQLLAGRGPLVLAPRMLSQPVAVAEVGRQLVDLAHGEPRGMAPALAGPDRLRMEELVRRLARVRGDRRPVLPLRVPGRVGRQMTGGALLPSGPGPRGTVSFDEWLRGQASSVAGDR